MENEKSSDPVEINAASAASQVTSALKRAGARTGADFDFLMKMAQRESSLNPNAKAKTSSAAGLFQFIEQTWLGAVKQYGARHGLSSYAAEISRGADGRFAVSNAARREEILNLRFDAGASAALAGELANQNRAHLESRLGRAANAADLYTAHFLGPAGAVKLLSAASTAKAADLMPRAAAANKHVFYDGERAKSVGEVVASIAKSMGGALAEAHTAPAPAIEVKAASFYREVKDMSAPERAIMTPRVKTDAIEAPALPFSRLSALAMSVLQALDPTRLSVGREDHKQQL